MPEETIDPRKVEVRWGVMIPLRDGVHLCATVYLPSVRAQPAPAIFTLTPYIAQTWHDYGMYFAAHGSPFLTIDVRGRGNSEGIFRPLIHEATDAYDIVEWLAGQPYCNGAVSMWGGSYAGYAQWAAASQLPPHLATIVPAAAPHIGTDFPMLGNITTTYLMQWLTLVFGRTSQDRLFWQNERFWGAKFAQWLESGAAFRELDSQLGYPSEIFQEWLAHPEPDEHWARLNPTGEQYASLSIPILSITGAHDAAQWGALTHYREHLRHASPKQRAQHYLIIGPWDHAGTRAPMSRFCGLEVGPDSLVDLRKLHCEWYAWTMQAGAKPAFLKKNVAYYVMVSEKWRYADSLEAATARQRRLYLHSTGNPTDIFNSGTLSERALVASESDQYVYDPRDTSLAALESTIDPLSRLDHRMVYASAGRHLVYHSAPLTADAEITGFFKLDLWISIDQPDTDIRASIYDVGVDGSAVLLTSDSIRARYRESLVRPKLIDTREPLLYSFERFMFVSRLIKAGHRLRLVIGAINSIFNQKNYNSGGVVSDETVRDARVVTVTLIHDASRPSVLHVPIGQPESSQAHHD
jgi:uncharacterized protein